VNPQDLSVETTRGLNFLLGLGGLAVLIAFLSFASIYLQNRFAKMNDEGSRALILWTAVLAGATIASAIVAVFTLRAIEGQWDEMQAEQRAWIYAETLIGKRIGESGEPYYIPITLYYHNTGHLFAFFVFPRVTASVFEGRIPTQNEICDDYRKRPLKDTDDGETIFPGEEHRGNNTNVEFDKSEWITTIKASQAKSSHQAVAISILGCIDYRYPGGETTHHQTRFSLIVGSAGPTGRVAILPADPTSVDIAIASTNQGRMSSAD
jgi:hypothetical protein